MFETGRSGACSTACATLLIEAFLLARAFKGRGDLLQYFEVHVSDAMAGLLYSKVPWHIKLAISVFIVCLMG